MKKLKAYKYWSGGPMVNTFSTDIMAAPFMGGGQATPIYSSIQGAQVIPPMTAYARAGDPTAMAINSQVRTQRATSAINNLVTPDNLTKGFKAIKSLFKSSDDESSSDEYSTETGDVSEKGKFMSSKLGKATGVAGQALAGFYDAIPTADKVVNENDEFTTGIRSTANKALLSSGNPIAMGIGAVNTILDKTGGFTDGSQGLGGANDFANGAASLLLPGAGFFTKRTEKYKKSEELANSSAYTGTSAAGDKAMKNAGAKILFGRGKANRMIREQKQRDSQVQDIIADARDDKAGVASANFIAGRNQMDSMGGYTALRVQKGGLLVNLEFLKRCKKKLQEGGSVQNSAMPVDFVERIEVTNGTKGTVDSITNNAKVNKKEEKIKPINQQQPQQIQQPTTQPTSKVGAFYFKHGGKVNVIPSGKLHKERHRLEKVVEGMDKVSKKGIPIVITNNAGELRQQAEIERNEIILNKDLSGKILELMDSEDIETAMIEAGKLLSDEVMENTEDNTGLIKSVKV